MGDNFVKILPWAQEVEPLCHLDVVVWIPVHVIDDDSVSGGKIDPQSSRLR